ncbi:MAG: RnfABCDGE type electron transport complex subunit D [Clostridia bacterium]|jgi:electron transport complex protein RnfD|nr:RnfABCDGE type electron transport complex subunit D [Clostridia bacterium]MBQ1255469.1 RnfABCDGE type electron transport complex subunit D [Clostridia bacterium]MBQ2254950.1 RnfABCDGE type electron transport complex subunit D [Clostridia bacterium]MBQ5791611.1 RnfABCDGE type electron transport complex subunit D [Clostridia bacterium]
MSKLHISSTPHIHQKGSSTRNIMLDVVIAMLPATIAGIVIFGISALWTVLTCVISAVVAEYVFNLCVGKKQTIGDLSAVVTGLLLALNVSTAVPLWQCVVGSVFAIVVVKCLFGGIGKNIVNPAITARVFMLLTFGAVGAVALPTVVEITTGATPLAALNQGAEVGAAEAPSLMDLFLGLHGGAIGETCAAALLLGFVYLVVRKVIKWYVPVSFVATTFLCYFLFCGFDAYFALQHVLAGGLLLGAIFMATDYVTTPNTGSGRVVFCIGAGLLTFAIRQFGMFPEGVSIAILTMNLLTPFICDFTKKKTLGGVR